MIGGDRWTVPLRYSFFMVKKNIGHNFEKQRPQRNRWQRERERERERDLLGGCEWGVR